jgi:hypothetical protein
MGPSCSASGGFRACDVDVGPFDDRILHVSDAFDFATDSIAGLEKDRWIAKDPDAGRRAGGQGRGIDRDASVL